MKGFFILVAPFFSYEWYLGSGNMYILWLIIGLIYLIGEIGHPGLFYSLSLCIGSLIAAGCAWFGYSISVQWTACIAGSLCAMIVLKEWVMRDQKNVHQSNVYALKGKEATVTYAIPQHDYGQVKVDGQIWRAQAKSGNVIQAHERVRIVGVQGARLIVEKITI